MLWASTRCRTRVLLLAVVLFEPVYVGLRVPNLWSGQELVRFVKDHVNADRAESLEYRFKCENLLIAKAIEQPVFGWGGWDRSTVYFDDDYLDTYPRCPHRRVVDYHSWHEGLCRLDPVLPRLSSCR